MLTIILILTVLLLKILEAATVTRMDLDMKVEKWVAVQMLTIHRQAMTVLVLTVLVLVLAAAVLVVAVELVVLLVVVQT